jgi:hypothetical protein
MMILHLKRFLQRNLLLKNQPQLLNRQLRNQLKANQVPKMMILLRKFLQRKQFLLNRLQKLLLKRNQMMKMTKIWVQMNRKRNRPQKLLIIPLLKNKLHLLLKENIKKCLLEIFLSTLTIKLYENTLHSTEKLTVLKY